MSAIVTCEHATNHVPGHLAPLFQGQQDLLESHEGYDLGALSYGALIAKGLHTTVVAASVSRLVVDHNRSEGHPRLFSSTTRNLSASEHEGILENYYRPFRHTVETQIRHALVHSRPIVHLSCHSFTPIWKGKVRPTDIGVLYDPARSNELRFAEQLVLTLRNGLRSLNVHKNRPYRGTSDGHTTALRGIFDADCYIGVEIEVNQRALPHSKALAQLVVQAVDNFGNAT